MVKKVFSHLSKELQEKYGRRSFPLRVGDTVKVMRGKFKGHVGKVVEINRKEERVKIEGLEREKVDGTKVLVPIHASNLEIIELNLEDPYRKKMLERGGKGAS